MVMTSNEASDTKLKASARVTQAGVTRNSLSNSRDIQREIEQVRAENELMQEYVKSVERKNRHWEARKAVEEERPIREQ
tara:strand:- start:193 stop:429 length:237 start_codon:yes stop_codon:yes gene_type:complete